MFDPGVGKFLPPFDSPRLYLVGNRVKGDELSVVEDSPYNLFWDWLRHDCVVSVSANLRNHGVNIRHFAFVGFASGSVPSRPKRVVFDVFQTTKNFRGTPRCYKVA